MRKSWVFLFLIAFINSCAADVLIAPPTEKRLPPPPNILPRDLEVLRLQVTPDPVHEGEMVRFIMTLANKSPYRGRISFFVKDQDEVAATAYDVPIRPGQNRIEFGQTAYWFHRSESCFSVEVDMERARRPLDSSRSFCAWKTQGGWTVAEARIGPFFVEDLDMFPDPIYAREEVHFKAKLRNEGKPVRANIWIQDRDQVVTILESALIVPGYGEYEFPYSRYVFQRDDHCFTVFIDVDRQDQKVDAKRVFCAKPVSMGRGWTLGP